MTAEFVRERITQLRLQKGVSEYKMSYDLGYGRGDINNASFWKFLLPRIDRLFLLNIDNMAFVIEINKSFAKIKSKKLYKK